MRTLLVRLAGSGDRRIEIALGAALLALLLPSVMWLPLIYQIAVPVSVAVGFAFLARPKQALLAIFGGRVIVDLLWATEAGGLGVNLMELFSGMVSVLAVLLVVQHLDEVQRHPWFPAFVPFVAVIGVAAVRSGDPRTAVEVAARFLSPSLLMFLVAAHYGDVRDRRRLEILVPVMALVPVAVGFWEWSQGQSDEEILHGYARLKGGYSNIHNHAHAMAFFAALGVLWLRRWGLAWRSVPIAAFIVACCTLMFLTYVRTALLGFVLFVVVFLVAEQLWRLAGVALLAGALATTSSAVLQDRFSDVAQLVTADESAGEDKGQIGSGRIHIWSTAGSRWLERPPFDVLFGMGLDQHKHLDDRGLDSHNDYLGLLFQMGPVALISYLAFQVQLAAAAWHVRVTATEPATRTLASFILALGAMVLLTNALSNSYVTRVHIAWLFWGFAGALFAAYAAERRA